MQWPSVKRSPSFANRSMFGVGINLVDRLQKQFNRSYRYREALYDGDNPYVTAIKNNMLHLVRILKSGDWRLLRRSPPYFVGVQGAMHNIERMVRSQLQKIPVEHANSPDYVSA